MQTSSCSRQRTVQQAACWEHCWSLASSSSSSSSLWEPLRRRPLSTPTGPRQRRQQWSVSQRWYPRAPHPHRYHQMDLQSHPGCSRRQPSCRRGLTLEWVASTRTRLRRTPSASRTHGPWLRWARCCSSLRHNPAETVVDTTLRHHSRCLSRTRCRQPGSSKPKCS